MLVQRDHCHTAIVTSNFTTSIIILIGTSTNFVGFNVKKIFCIGHFMHFNDVISCTNFLKYNIINSTNQIGRVH